MTIPNYSTDPFYTRTPNSTAEVPFKVHLRYVPYTDGRRMTKVRDIQKKAMIIQSELKDAGMNIATPVAYTYQFGQYTGRMTVVGFWSMDVTRGNAPATDAVPLITSGTVPGEKTHVEEGDKGGGNLSYGQVPTALVLSEVVALIAALKANSSTLDENCEIEFVDYNGIKFGRNAQTIPQ